MLVKDTVYKSFVGKGTVNKINQSLVRGEVDKSGVVVAAFLS